MIKSFNDKVTLHLFHGISSSKVRKLPNQMVKTALYKLDMINAVASLNDLRSPPGNRLEALSGAYKGFHSIQINSQWRIIFQWKSSNAYEVAIVDYHT